MTQSKSIKRTPVRDTMRKIVQMLLADEIMGGKFLLVAVVIALLFTNSPWTTGYHHFWQQSFSISLGRFGITDTLQGWINEGLMAIFFLVVGLEIKREIVRGQLRTFRAASLPIFAALGGMLVPGLLYMIINTGHSGFAGWGIPMSTDIAFAVSALALVGKRIPSGLRLFLLTLAVVDDVGAVIVIALFYAHGIHVLPLCIAAFVVGVIVLLRRMRWLRMPTFVLLGVVLWIALYQSGIHAAIAGALLGLLAPIATAAKHGTSIAGRLERLCIPISAFVIIPIFALANAGVRLNIHAFNGTDSILVGAGIIFGLIIGKSLGVLVTSWVLVRLGIAQLPIQVTWSLLFGAGLLAGIGFTISLFLTEVAFNGSSLEEPAKVSIFIASFLSALLGIVCLRVATRARVPEAEKLP